MATAINISATGTSSGTPLTAAAITVGAAAEEVITFTNMPAHRGFDLLISTPGTDFTYGFATGETGGDLIPNEVNVIKGFTGRTLYVNSAAGGALYLRIL